MTRPFYHPSGASYEPHFPEWRSLPEIAPGLRMVGTSLMDQEQFDVEEWHDVNGDFRPSIQGIHRYAQLRASRKDQRKVAWQSRTEADDAWSDEINRTIEESVK